MLGLLVYKVSWISVLKIKSMSYLFARISLAFLLIFHLLPYHQIMKQQQQLYYQCITSQNYNDTRVTNLINWALSRISDSEVFTMLSPNKKHPSMFSLAKTGASSILKSGLSARMT